VPLEQVTAGLRKATAGAHSPPPLRWIRTPVGLEGRFQGEFDDAVEPERARARLLEERLIEVFDPEGILPGRWNPEVWRGNQAPLGTSGSWGNR
jgi:hypothetical protein